jgi:hypothetical protein
MIPAGVVYFQIECCVHCTVQSLEKPEIWKHLFLISREINKKQNNILIIMINKYL